MEYYTIKISNMRYHMLNIAQKYIKNTYYIIEIGKTKPSIIYGALEIKV